MNTYVYDKLVTQSLHSCMMNRVPFLSWCIGEGDNNLGSSGSISIISFKAGVRFVCKGEKHVGIGDGQMIRWSELDSSCICSWSIFSSFTNRWILSWSMKTFSLGSDRSWLAILNPKKWNSSATFAALRISSSFSSAVWMCSGTMSPLFDVFLFFALTDVVQKDVGHEDDGAYEVDGDERSRTTFSEGKFWMVLELSKN